MVDIFIGYCLYKLYKYVLNKQKKQYIISINDAMVEDKAVLRS